MGRKALKTSVEMPTALRRSMRRLAVWIVLFLTTPIALVFRIFGIRFLGTGVEHRFGHLVAEPFYAACLRVGESRAYRYLVVTYSPAKVSNMAVIQALPDYFIRVENAFLRALLKPFQRHPICDVDMASGVRTATGEAHLYQLLATGQRPTSFLQPSSWYPKNAQEVLSYLGIHDRDWYVILHVRDGSTYGELDAMHDYRDGSLEALAPTIQAVTSAGGAVIRVGDPSLPPLPDGDGILDYARHVKKLPDDDLFLYKHTRLFIGNTSGPVVLAGVERVPIVAVNTAPMGACLVWDATAICVPKIYVRKATGKEIPFAEVFGTELADIRSSAAFTSAGVSLRESGPDEILGAVEEALGLRRNDIESEWDRLAQLRFRRLFRGKNYSRFSTSRVSRFFLRKYAHLLPLDSGFL